MLCARSYQPRTFDQTLLHRCVTQHWPRLRLACETHGRPLPPFVKREFEAYLRCGDLREGFLRIHCAGCGHDRLVPFSCKGRGFCPSCGGRRMHEGAAWLCERVLPPVPLRQWVLSLPKVLRYLLAYDGKLCRAVARTAMQEVFRYQRLRARRALRLGSTRQAQTGAMVAVQRFGSALNLNIHFHALVLDGVFMVDAFGHPTFVPLAPPCLEDLHRVVARIADAVLALLRRRRIWVDELDEEEDPVAQHSESLAGMAKASIAGTLVFGSAGAKPVRLQDARVWVPEQVERAGKALGFVLDAEVRVSADNRFHRERLCRYLLRPPLAKGRLHETMDGKYAFELKTPWPDGTRVIFFSGEELVARLSALVPPPRMHLVHYFGVLAPNARLRKQVVPEAPEDADLDPCGHSVAYAETRNGRTIRRRWVPWATLLLRVFAIDVMACPRCDSRMQRIAVIQQPNVIAAILDCLSRKEQPP
jgi:ribosomal protein S27E